jgi:hypothetical protein
MGIEDEEAPVPLLRTHALIIALTKTKQGTRPMQPVILHF